MLGCWQEAGGGLKSEIEYAQQEGCRGGGGGTPRRGEVGSGPGPEGPREVQEEVRGRGVSRAEEAVLRVWTRVPQFMGRSPRGVLGMGAGEERGGGWLVKSPG